MNPCQPFSFQYAHTIAVIGTKRKTQDAFQPSRISVYIGYCTGEESSELRSNFLTIGTTASTEYTLTDPLISEFSESRGFF